MVMYNTWFAIGMIFTLGLNTALIQVVNGMSSAVISIVGGVVSAVVVAWFRQQWEEKRK